MKRILFALASSLTLLSAQAAVITDRASFEASISLAYKEDFQTLGNATVAFTGPALLPSGLSVSSTNNNLFVAGPGQSSNSSSAIGSNSPSSDYLIFDLGGDYMAFGADLFQNFGGGSQSGAAIDFQLRFFNDGLLLDTIVGSVAPNGGSFLGYTSAQGFDRVEVFSLADSFEVADDVTVGNVDSNRVPEPGALALTGLALAGLALRRRKA